MKSAQINKPILKAPEALAFASESTKQSNRWLNPKEENKQAKRGSQSKRIFHAPEGDKRLLLTSKKTYTRNSRLQLLSRIRQQAN
ncbi:hypothetical protein [Methylophaga nitratireducenticrescens]|uniref:hypothetical protein n=1 Tax=Methylophaga nitratireducenticrescens TaxID=754476 RepID=UPI000CDCCFA8|nr:hypothetical protein [Methylophaga nitratireducenticrescens]AUZ83799.1 hypothetical protein CDW43_04080 [Methylophaga nitratireducenticrescens]